MVGTKRHQSDSGRASSAVGQLLQSVHGGALLDLNPRPPGSRRLSLDSCRHQEGRTRVYSRSPAKDGLPIAEDPPAFKEAERLQQEVQEVHRTLIYIRAVVQQQKVEILPHSATHILDTVMNVFTTLRNTDVAGDSSQLQSCQAKVCQSLAKFIHWTDSLLVSPQGDFNKDNAKEIIETLSAGIKELSQLWQDKMTNHRAALKSPASQGVLLAPPPDGARRVSLPDIPLTPREQEILVQTSDLSSYDNVDSLRRCKPAKAQDVFSFDDDASDVGPPPPKPPLPVGASGLLPKLLRQHHQESPGSVANGDESMPPPLPQKRRSHNDMLNSMGSLNSIGSGQSTPTGASSHLTGAVSDTTIGSLASTNPSISSSEDLRSSGIGSLGSVCSGGQATILMSRSSHSSVYSRTSSETRIISSSSVLPDGSRNSGGGKPFDEINSLTSEIKKLTTGTVDAPPPLPVKKGSLQRLMSQYDNIPDNIVGGQTFTSSTVTQSTTVQTQRIVMSRTVDSSSRISSSSSSQSSLQQAMHSERSASSSVQETFSSSETFSSASHSSTESLPKPPPLPPKKRHIHAYIQTFGTMAQPLSMESISRHSINFYEAQWHQHQMELTVPVYPRSNTISVFSDISSDSSFSSGSPERFAGNVPALPLKTRRSFQDHRSSQVSTGSSQSEGSYGEFTHSHSAGAINLMDVDPRRLPSQLQSLPATVEPPPLVHPHPLVSPSPITSSAATPPTTTLAASTATSASPGSPSVTVSATTKPEIPRDADSAFAELNPLDDIDVSDQLVRKKEGEDGPEIRGGTRDALVVHATSAGKTGLDGDSGDTEEFIYQEAFLTTYRTFIQPRDLIDKLLYRFHKFHRAGDHRKKLSRNSFSLLIRVIDELGHMELEDEIVEKMVSLVYELLCQCELVLARLLRRKLLEKCEKKQAAHDQPSNTTPVHNIDLSASTPDLLSFKSLDIAEQMTLLDAQLFQKIEIPEVLLWAKEQSEEQSPNLTTFTEHFNKMSYWCRTRILTQEDPKERERYLMKFIKIMRYLRKLKNFNSYLAILSALDSAPVRRLEWQKQNIEALQEFCQLIDSSSSFRAYRQALAETEPPCIPYLGLILQDLTFINIGNQDALPDGSINFAKRWQQFNILDSMRRFKTSQYGFKRNDKILAMMDNFEDCRNEEVLWQMSQKLKPPRQTHKKQDSVT